jgi:hypothetical protein
MPISTGRNRYAEMTNVEARMTNEEGPPRKRWPLVIWSFELRHSFVISISLPNNEQVFDDKSGGEGWQNDALGQL